MYDHSNNTSQGTWRMLMHWKTMFNRYYCIKTENICYISRYFLHYFVSPFHRCLTNAISTVCARSSARHNTSRNGSKSVCTAINNMRHCFLCNNIYKSGKKYWYSFFDKRLTLKHLVTNSLTEQQMLTLLKIIINVWCKFFLSKM